VPPQPWPPVRSRAEPVNIPLPPPHPASDRVALDEPAIWNNAHFFRLNVGEQGAQRRRKPTPLIPTRPDSDSSSLDIAPGPSEIIL
jgi:hypothetical protein